MFVRVTWTAGAVERWLSADRESLRRELQSQPGWIATTALVDQQTGTGVSVGYWESEEALRASEPGHIARTRRGESLGMRTRETDQFEIVCQERRAPPREHTFTRLVDLHGTPAKLDETIAFVRERVAPLVREQHGFRALIMGVNRRERPLARSLRLGLSRAPRRERRGHGRNASAGCPDCGCRAGARGVVRGRSAGGEKRGSTWG